MASAGPYASLHLAPDRQPCQYLTTQFFTGRMPFLPPKERCLTVQQRCTWGVSLTILNIRLIRLVPSNAGLSAHISYRRQPSAYRYSSPQETCSKISKAVHKELILNTGIYFSWYYKWLAQAGQVFFYIMFDMVRVRHIASCSTMNAATADINTTTT